MAAAIWAGSAGGTRSPSAPSAMRWGTPPTFVLTTQGPQAMASTTVTGELSMVVVFRKISPRSIQEGISVFGTPPWKRTASPTTEFGGSGAGLLEAAVVFVGTDHLECRGGDAFAKKREGADGESGVVDFVKCAEPDESRRGIVAQAERVAGEFDRVRDQLQIGAVGAHCFDEKSGRRGDGTGRCEQAADAAGPLAGEAGKSAAVESQNVRFTGAAQRECGRFRPEERRAAIDIHLGQIILAAEAGDGRNDVDETGDPRGFRRGREDGPAGIREADREFLADAASADRGREKVADQEYGAHRGIHIRLSRMNAPNSGAVWTGGVGTTPFGWAAVRFIIGMPMGEPSNVPAATGGPKKFWASRTS